MTKNEFLRELSKKLSNLKKDEREKSLSYYNEFIDDSIESGLNEEDTIATMDVASIAKGILGEASVNGTPKQKRKSFLTVLIILGSPLWLTLLVAFASIALALCISVFAVILAVAITIFALYISLWAVIISLFAVVLSLVLGGIGGIVGFFVFIFYNTPIAFLNLGAGFACIALGMLSYLGVLQLTKWFIRGTVYVWRNMVNAISNTMIKRRAK